MQLPPSTTGNGTPRFHRRRSIGWILVAAVLLLLPPLFDRVRRGVSSAGGRLTVEPRAAVLMLGESVEDGLVRSTSFTLRNIGQGPLTIRHVQTSCGCTVSGLRVPIIISPGAEISLPLQVTLPRFGAKQTMVTVVTDSTQTPTERIRLDLRGELLPVPQVVMIPQSLEVSGFAPGQTVSREFVVSTLERRGTTAWITGWTTSDDHVAVAVQEMQETENAIDDAVSREYRCIATSTAPNSELQPRAVQLVPAVATPAAATLPVVELVVRLTSALRSIPSEIVVRSDDGPREARLLVRSESDLPWRITGVSTTASWLQAVELPRATADGRVSVIVVSISQPPVDGQETAAILVKTTNAECAELRIPVKLASAE